MESHLAGEEQLDEIRAVPSVSRDRQAPSLAWLGALYGEREHELPAPDSDDPSLRSWDLSRAGLIYHAAGEREQALRFHEMAAAAAETEEGCWKAWIMMRCARLLMELDRDEEAVRLCRRVAEAARSEGWQAEEAAACEISGDEPEGFERSELDQTWEMFRMGRKAYLKGDLDAAVKAMRIYLERILMLQRELREAGLSTYVMPAETSEAFGIVVDCLTLRESTWLEALQWSERGKLWSFNSDSWHPIIAPVADSWIYPFARSPKAVAGKPRGDRI
jgi:tetratricopeptide (TPR) repeat protein